MALPPDIDDEIAALHAAISSGVKRVVTQTNGVRKEVEYPSFADLKARYDWLLRQKAGAGRRRITLASF
jgi:hypothetical protein